MVAYLRREKSIMNILRSRYYFFFKKSMLRHIKEMKFKAAEQFQMSPSSKDAGNTAAPQHQERTGLILYYGFK